MKFLPAPAVLVVALMFSAIPLSAHHSWPVNMTRLVTVKGTVQKIQWTNPHPMFTIEVRDGAKAETWLIGGPALGRMEANGWTKDTIKVGDVVIGTGYQFADGQKIIRLEHVVLSGGKELGVYGR